MKCINRKLNTPWISDRKYKKFQVCARDKFTGKVVNIHYGDKRYEDFTQHKDRARRRNFRLRHGCDPVSKLNKGTAKYWACQDLW